MGQDGSRDLVLGIVLVIPTHREPWLILTKNGSCIGDILNLDITVPDAPLDDQVLHLLVSWVRKHRLNPPCLKGLLDLFLCVPIKAFAKRFNHSHPDSMLPHIYVWHAVAQPRVALERDFLPLWSCDHSIPLGVVVYNVPVLFELWN